jgi:hypothetical protein
MKMISLKLLIYANILFVSFAYAVDDCKDLQFWKKGQSFYSSSNKIECLKNFLNEINDHAKLHPNLYSRNFKANFQLKETVDITNLIPNMIKDNVGKRLSYNGPNCFNTALYLAQESSPRLIYSPASEILNELKSGRLITVQVPRYGDIILFLQMNTQDEFQSFKTMEEWSQHNFPFAHAAFYIGGGNVFEKIGYAKEDSFEISSIKNIIGRWESMLSFREMISDPDFPSVFQTPIGGVGKLLNKMGLTDWPEHVRSYLVLRPAEKHNIVKNPNLLETRLEQLLKNETEASSKMLTMLSRLGPEGFALLSIDTQKSLKKTIFEILLSAKKLVQSEFGSVENISPVIYEDARLFSAFSDFITKINQLDDVALMQFELENASPFNVEFQNEWNDYLIRNLNIDFSRFLIRP